MDQSRNYDQLGVENCHKKSFTIGTEEKRGCKFSVGNYSCRNRGGSDFLMNIPSNGNAVMEEGCVEPSSQAAAGQSSPASTNLESRTSFDVPELKSSGSSCHQNCEGVTSKHASKPVKKRYIHRLRDKLLKTQPCLSGLIRKKQSLCNILQKAVSNSSPQEMTESAAIICSSRAEEARLVSDMDSVFFACDWVRRGGRIRNKEEGEEDGDSKQVHWNERVHICGEEESETLCSCCDNYGYYPENDGAGEQSSLPSTNKSSNVRSNPSHEVLELDEAVLRREEDEFGASGGGGNAPWLSANPRTSNGQNQDSVPTPRRSGPGRSASLNSVVQSPQPTSTPDPKATLASTSDSILCKKPGETDEQRIARLLKFGFAPVIPMQNKSGPSHSETPAAEDDEEPEEKEPKPPLQFGFVRIPENPNKPQQEPNQDCENPSHFYGNNQENEEPASRQSVPSEGDPLGGGVQPVSPSLSPVSKASNYTAMLRPGAGNTDDIEALRSRMRARFMLKDRDLPPHAS
ncbi:unnamed protein product [Notodromas monacha]|uniref:Uncharacterized protein n=1 Tax=Notodromas monacha TaxID=399045 RepID=A0A7R9BPW9_9CRUS|nr:unnamed protein product [Notodromas monacha]CAG0918139.1 unnamed protein product [Notodromas monacha]